MKVKIESSKTAPAVGPFSQAIKVGGLIFTSGQVALDKDGKMVGGKIEEQARQVMENLQAVLQEGGADFGDVVKTTIFLTDMNVYGRVNKIYKEYMSEPFPARETIGVKALPLGAEVEISMLAVGH